MKSSLPGPEQRSDEHAAIDAGQSKARHAFPQSASSSCKQNLCPEALQLIQSFPQRQFFFREGVHGYL